MSGTESPDFDRAAESHQILQEARQDRDEIKRLRGGLDAAIRAANLALFVVRKQNVMPNSSWDAGFKKDMATAEAARVPQQSAQEKL